MSSNKRWLAVGAALLIALVVVSAMRPDTAWEGVDAAVVQKYAAAMGREAWTPFVNVQGDLLLFVFAVAGAIGGFVAGYCWRDLFGPAHRQTIGKADDAQPR